AALHPRNHILWTASRSENDDARRETIHLIDRRKKLNEVVFDDLGAMRVLNDANNLRTRLAGIEIHAFAKRTLIRPPQSRGSFVDDDDVGRGSMIGRGKRSASDDLGANHVEVVDRDSVVVRAALARQWGRVASGNFEAFRITALERRSECN